MWLKTFYLGNFLTFSQNLLKVMQIEAKTIFKSQKPKVKISLNKKSFKKIGKIIFTYISEHQASFGTKKNSLWPLLEGGCWGLHDVLQEIKYFFNNKKLYFIKKMIKKIKLKN